MTSRRFASLRRRSIRWVCLATIAALACGCAAAGAGGEDSEGDHEDWFDEGLSDQVAQRWQLAPEVVERANAYRITYDGAPAWSMKNCTGKFEPGPAELADFVKGKYSQVTQVGGYTCRANTANTKELSIHGTGRAIDIFIPVAGPRQANNELGDPVANWLVLNAELLGVQYVIWDRSQWSGSRAKDKFRAYDGPHPHHDHIHLEFNKQGAARMTEWFTNGHMGLELMDGGGDGSSWIGTACTDTVDCLFEDSGRDGSCASWFDEDVAELHGFCTLSCDGICPDRPGHAPTFCAASDAGGGQCVAVADTKNDNCFGIPGTEPRVVQRYNSSTTGIPGIGTVCLPPDRAGIACSSTFGECIDTDVMTCGSATVSGQCPGGADIRCCPF